MPRCKLFYTTAGNCNLSVNRRVLPGAETREGIVLAGAGARLAKKSGYCYLYISNESDDLVYFDNLTLTHERSPLLEETHYYPFGLSMAGISSKAANSLENRYKFNDGTELNGDLGLDWYETRHRGYDAQIGRFHQTDILSDFFQEEAPYTFSGNNPISFNDKLGLRPRKVGTTEDGTMIYEDEEVQKATEVTITGKKPKPKSPTLADRTFGWANGNKKEARQEMERRWSYYAQRDAGMAAGGNDLYDRLYKREQEYRSMQTWAVGVMAAPFVATALVESGALVQSGRLINYSGKALIRLGKWTLAPRVGLNLAGGGADVASQLIVKGRIDNVSSIVANTVVGNPLVAAVIGTARFDLSGIDRNFGTNVAISTLGNVIGNIPGFGGGLFGIKVSPGAEFTANMAGNTVSSILSGDLQEP